MSGDFSRPEPPANLAGYRLLVIEDDYFVAHDLCSVLRARGATVLGPARNVKAGRELANSSQPDCVLLDINLHGEHAFELASDLQSRGVRIVFTTGYDQAFIPPRLRHTTCLQKPLDTNALIRSIRLRPAALGAP